MTTKNDMEVGFIHAETGEILMLNKKERILVKEILGKTLSSKEAKEAIKNQFGKEYIEIAYRLFENVGGSKIDTSKQ
jgi:hypothetical protein